MSLLDIVDESFVAADPKSARSVLCDEARWRKWFPGLVLDCFDDRGPLGKRWAVSGRLVGTAEVWLEEYGDGVLLHVYIRADPADRAGSAAAEGRTASERTRRRLRRRYALPLKRRMFEAKDEIEAAALPRSAGEPVDREPVVSLTEPSPSTVPMSAVRDPGRASMADQTTSDIVVAATPEAIMAVIADFEAYPTWATGVKETEVLEQGSTGRADRVRFVLDATPIRDEYVLAYTWSGDRQVTWTLVEGKMLKGMDGAYVLAPRGDGSTTVTYRLAVSVAIPLIGMLKRKAEKVIIDTALKGLKKRVEAR
ncbi:MAG: SRPBCC family protein [Nocardioidaceae bacterium]